MGARLSRKATLPFNPSDYEEVLPKRNFDDLNDPQHYRILKHIRTGIEMEEYKLQFNDEQQYNEYYDAFEWRLMQEFIVNTCYFIENNRKEFCSTHYGAYIYNERIPIKLSQIKDIPFPDNLYILYTSLEGFHTIYHKTGFFQIQEHMVCINQQGKVKIWINDNLSKKYPESIYTQTDGSEEDMVQRIIQIIADNTDGTSQPIPVPQYMAKHINRPNFNDAKMLLRQYAKEHAVAIPKSFECILEVLNSEYNHSQLTDSRVDDIKTFNGKGSRNQPPSIRSSRHNNLKSRSRGVGNYQSGVSQADSRSQKSLQQQNFELYKQSHQNGLVEVRGNRVPRLTHPVPQFQTGAHIPHHVVQSRFQPTSTGFLELPNQRSYIRSPNTFLKNPLPVINEGRPIIQHVHCPAVNPGINSSMLVPNYNSPASLMMQPQIRPQFYSVHQQPEMIISPTPSNQHILHHANAYDDHLLLKERRLNIYSDQEDSQMVLDSQLHNVYETQQQQAYAMAYAPAAMKRVAVVQHHYNVNQSPYQLPQPYLINNNNISRPEYVPQHIIQQNIYDRSQISNKSSQKQQSLSQSKKYSSDVENSKDKNRKKRRLRRHQNQSSDQSQTDEQYDDSRRKNRRKQQQIYYRRQEHVIDEDEDDDEQEQRIRKSRRRQKKYREEQAKISMYREREQQQFRRIRKQQQGEEYRRRRQQDQFRRRSSEEKFKRRLQQDELERLERKAADDFQRQLRFQEEARKQKQQQEEYLTQKHREELEYNRSRDYHQANQRYKSEASSYHEGKRSNANRANTSQHQSSAGIGMVSATRDETRNSNNFYMQTGQRLDEQPFRYQTQTATFMYYSSEQDHQLDPEIARDLMIMQL